MNIIKHLFCFMIEFEDVFSFLVTQSRPVPIEPIKSLFLVCNKTAFGHGDHAKDKLIDQRGFLSGSCERNHDPRNNGSDRCCGDNKFV